MSSGPFTLSPVAQSYLSSGNSLVTGLGGARGFGETELPPNDDESTGAIDITSVFGPAGLNFFGANYTSLYVNNNGNITFNAPSGEYTPTEITGGSGNPIIAAFWADVDTGGGPRGATPGGTSTGSNTVTYDLDAANGVLTVTWDDVGYYSENTDKANAFQIQLISRGGGDFDILYRYEDINWSAGGTGGLGGTPARAGFSSGNAAQYYELPQSGNEAGVLGFESTGGNSGRPGVWIFQVRSGAVTPVGAPDAVDDVLAVSEDRFSLDARSFAGSVLANDTAGTSPAAGAATVTSVGEGASAVGQAVQGRYGTLVLRADGSYTYTLSNTDALIAGETGVERFAYTIGTAGGLTDTAVLEIRVQGEDLEILRPGAFSAHRGADRIGGSEGEDRLAGRAGDDALAGFGGDDLLWGEDGNDTLMAGEGDDRSVGGAGDDALWLGAGDDRGWGEAGSDAIHGEAGEDQADGGADDDRLELGSGDDRGWGGEGNDALVGGAGEDRLSGGGGDDAVQGQGGSDRLWGGDGADVLEGGSGADQFNGGGDGDRLVLDGGSDTAWGGDGDDVFVAGAGADVIKDFQDGDRIDLSAVFRSYAALESRMAEEDGDVVIDLPGRSNTLTIEKVDALDRGDFLL